MSYLPLVQVQVLLYLCQCIEEHKIPQMHPKLKRLENVFADIHELQKSLFYKYCSILYK